VPLKNVELETDGSWSSLRRDVSNSWNANGGIYKCPLHIRLTSVLGDVIEDWVPSNEGGQGTGQFPVPTPDAAGATAGALPLTPQYPGEHCTAVFHALRNTYIAVHLHCHIYLQQPSAIPCFPHSQKLWLV